MLDLGCGYGGNLLLWAQRHSQTNFVGLEPAPHTVMVAEGARASLTRSNTQFLAGVGEHLPFADASFDLVMTFDVMEHVHDPRKVLREVVRCLRPGGIYLGAFPPYFGPMSHHLTYVTRLPMLHHIFPARLLVAAVNHLIDSGRLQLHRQPQPRQSVWGRTTLPSLNGTTVADWSALCRQVEKEAGVRIQNEFLPFARRLPVVGSLTTFLRRAFPTTDVFCGHIVTRIDRLS